MKMPSSSMHDMIQGESRLDFFHSDCPAAVWRNYNVRNKSGWWARLPWVIRNRRFAGIPKFSVDAKHFEIFKAVTLTCEACGTRIHVDVE